jgi:hypothetical protein
LPFLLIFGEGIALLYGYLTFDDPNPHLSPGPIQQVYQAMSDLMKLAADMDLNAE